MNPILETHIRVQKTARYFSIGNINSQTRNIVFVIHGYGTQVKDFIEKFRPWENESTVILAPEGLSKFYLQGKFEKVGASWMTKEDRLNEIEDHVEYLESVYNIFIQQAPKARVIILGFSQGAATIWRWVVTGNVIPDVMICFAGTVPEEGEEILRRKLEGKTLIGVFGKADPMIMTDRSESTANFLKNISQGAKIIWYEGGHDILPEPLEIISKEIF